MKVLESQESLKREENCTTIELQFTNYPNLQEDRATCDKFWKLSETATRKTCASLIAYNRGFFYCSYIHLRLFTPSGIADTITRRGSVKIRVGDIEKLLKSHMEFMVTLLRETLHNNKLLTVSTSLPTSLV